MLPRPFLTWVRDWAGQESRASSKAACVSAITTIHLGQYHGAGVFTGFGLRFRHFAQWYRLPFTAVLGRSRLPVRGMFLGMLSSGYLTSTAATAIPASPITQNPSTTKHPRVVRL